MWYDNLPKDKSWTSLIADYISCGCGGIRTISAACPACGASAYDPNLDAVEDSTGERYLIFAGAEGRVEDYQLLALMEREWRRPQVASAHQNWLTSGMSERASVVILFWTYFETRMNRLVESGLAPLPERVRDDLLSRHDSVSAHMKELYRIVFGVKYLDDLIAVGAESIGGHLARVQDARNRFVHGEPGALGDSLVEAVVRELKAEHEAWIAVFNRRVSIIRKNAAR
jgi:hypothetical protein